MSRPPLLPPSRDFSLSCGNSAWVGSADAPVRGRRRAGRETRLRNHRIQPEADADRPTMTASRSATASLPPTSSGTRAQAGRAASVRVVSEPQRAVTEKGDRAESGVYHCGRTLEGASKLLAKSRQSVCARGSFFTQNFTKRFPRTEVPRSALHDADSTAPTGAVMCS